MEVRIALDAMGGDQAPRETVRGAIEACAQDSALTVVLVGDERRIRAEIASAGVGEGRMEIVEAPDVIGGDEAPVEADVRRGRSVPYPQTTIALTRRHGSAFGL